MKRSALLWAVRLLCIFISLVVLFLGSMVLVYSLPQDTIPQHLEESVLVLRAEGVYPSRFISGTPFLQDNYTDALMLDTTFRETSDSPLVSAVAGAHGGLATIVALAQTATGGRTVVTHYPYYWSGYQVVLRPLIMLFNYTDIRRINLGALLALTSLVTYLVWRVAGRAAGVAFPLSLLVCGFMIVPWSLQYSSMTYLMLLAIAAVILSMKRAISERRELEIFFVVGMLAAFFDLLTAPLLTLGMPLVVALIVRSRSQSHARMTKQLLYAVAASAFWSIGYLSSWVAKTIIGQIVLHENVMAQAMGQFAFRASAGDGVSRADVMAMNIKQLYPLYLDGRVSSFGIQLELALGAVMLVVIGVLAVRYHRLNGGRLRVGSAAAVLFAVPLPYMWFAIASNHSQIHVKYTYRIQAIAVFALLYVAFCALETLVAQAES